MDTKTRILQCRLLEKLSARPEYSEKLGIRWTPEGPDSAEPRAEARHGSGERQGCAAPKHRQEATAAPDEVPKETEGGN